MPASPLRIAESAPPSFKHIATYIDLQLGDVHSMLRLPLPGAEGIPPIEAAGNFASANMLLAISSGLSTLVYLSRLNDSGARFRRLLCDYYPWGEERPNKRAVTGTDAADVLYEIYRNPQAHALAIHTVVEDGFIRMAPGLATYYAVCRQLESNDKPITEDQLVALETSASRPEFLAPTLLRQSDGGVFLTVEPLYWGVRRMIERLSADDARMKTAAWFLRESDVRPT